MLSHLSVALSLLVGPLWAQIGNPAITTGQYGPGRTSANANELFLTPTTVTVSRFGKLFSLPVDGWTFAQPLYVPGVTINGVSRNVVYVATMHNSIYAFDADQPGAGFLWHTRLELPVTGTTASGCPATGFTGPELGILSTPAIDLSTNTMYAVAATPSGNGYVHILHGLDITNGRDQPNSPVQINARVPGSGYDNQGGTIDLNVVSTDAQRTALLLANGNVYAGFGSCGPDQNPWHGWVVGYDTHNLQSQVALFNSTANGMAGGIWQSGRGLVADNSGNLFLTTGNGTFDPSDYGMSFVKLNANGQYAGSYPPPNADRLNYYDLDFSSSGPLLIPGTNSLVAGGKDGVFYLFDSNNPSTPLQNFQGTAFCSDLANNSPAADDGCYKTRDLAFWNNTLYVWGGRDVMRAYSFANGRFNATAVSKGTLTTGGYGAPMAVSANGNGTGTGIVWAVSSDGVVHAFDARNVATQLWSSSQNSTRDALPSFAKYAEPTVANGRVYVPTHSNQVVVYGMLSDFTLAASPTSQSVVQGSSTTFQVNLTALATLAAPVSFTVSGLPAGASASFSPSSLSASGSTTLTVATSASTPVGSAPLVVNGKTGNITRSASVTLNVQAATVPDTTPPQWTCCDYTPAGNSYQLTFHSWDAESGMASIVTTQVVDATVSIPSFTLGTHDVIAFSAIEDGWSSYVSFQLTDVAGNVSYIDPGILDLTRQPGNPNRQSLTFKQVKAAETTIEVKNLSPGLKNLRIDVNGEEFQLGGLKDDETTYLDISSALRDNDENTIVCTPLGKPGGRAIIIVGNIPIPAGDTERSK